MKPLKINRKNFKKVVAITTKAIKQGKVVICPTDTVYGLLADATNKKAVERLFKIKKRPKEKAVPIFVKDIKTAKKLAFIDKEQEKFLKKVWFTRPNFWKGAQKKEKLVKIAPKIWAGKGKLTVVLKKKAKIKIFGTNKNTIGLRTPNYKFINILLKKLNRPLTGTSANISGRPASTKIKEVIAQFTKRSIKPDLVIDAGNLKKSKPSTVIDLIKKEPNILRP